MCGRFESHGVLVARNMPDVDALMEEWPPEFEELLKEVCSFIYLVTTMQITAIIMYKKRKTFYLIFTAHFSTCLLYVWIGILSWLSHIKLGYVVSPNLIFQSLQQSSLFAS